VRYGFIGHNAWTGDIGADGIAYPMDGLTLTLGPRLGFGDNRFADTYFGISETESERSGLEAYDAKGGLLSAGVELGARYLFNDRWGVEGGASWGRLLNDAADSPITEEGSADQYRVRLGITRSISLDFWPRPSERPRRARLRPRMPTNVGLTADARRLVIDSAGGRA
jgi:outer membrane scaffolding protein for murein synthesis (MipA/OmpV family)